MSEVLAAAFHLLPTMQRFPEERICSRLRFDLQNYCLLCTVAHKHRMKYLQEAPERKMASTFNDICESEEFLSIIEPD